MRYNLILVSIFTLLTAQVATSQPFLKTLLEVTGERYDDALGTSVLALGDINGDGWPDFGVSVGGRRQFWIYYGGPGILDDKVDAILVGGRNAAIGDFNGDGYPDLISVKPILSDVANFDTAYVYLGKSGPGLMLDTIPAFKIPSASRSGNLGRYMAIGDLNGDGIQDLAVHEDYLRGRVYVFMGKPDFNGVPDFTGTIDSAYTQYGSEIQIADVNGDGFDDLVFGMLHDNRGQIWQRCHIHHGHDGWWFDYRNASQFLDSRNVEIPDSSKTWFLVPRVLDINGDGISDVTVAGKIQDQLYVFYGLRGMISSKPDFIIHNPVPGRYEYFFAYRPIQTAGDINKDSYRDFALRLGVFTQPYLVYSPGSKTGIQDYSFARSARFNEFGVYGESFANVGDVNGDSVDDLCSSSQAESANIHFGYFHVLAGDTKLVNVEPFKEQHPSGFAVSPNWPNPFSSVTTIEVSVEQPERVTVTVFDLLGREIAMLNDSRVEMGIHRFVWNGKKKDGIEAPNGIYICLVKTKNAVRSMMMNLIHNH